MKVEYEYETGWLKGKNEAIMEHTRIIQNKHNQLATKLEAVGEILIFQISNLKKYFSFKKENTNRSCCFLKWTTL